jgi:hypothetical protein
MPGVSLSGDVPTELLAAGADPFGQRRIGRHVPTLMPTVIVVSPLRWTKSAESVAWGIGHGVDT